MIGVDYLRYRTSEKWQKYPEDVLPLFVAEMDYPLAPAIAAALHLAIDRSDTGYAWPYRLRETFARYAKRRFGWTIQPERVVIVNDVMEGVSETLRALTPPGANVAIMPPVYPPFFEVIATANRHIVEIPLLERDNSYAVDWVTLEAQFAKGVKVLLLCHPHNPVGLVFPRVELRRLAALAQCYEVLVISDEIHAPIVYMGEHIPFAVLAEPLGVDVVTLMSASKAWNIPGLKCAQMVAGSERVHERFTQLPSEVTVRIGQLGVIATIAAYEHGGAWLRETLTLLNDNRKLVGELITAHLPGVVYRVPDATYLAWLDCRALPFGDDPAEVFLDRGRVALAPGPRFGEPGRGFVRLNFAASPDVIVQAVERMAHAVRVA